MSFKDKVVIVTGSSAGIGASAVIEFAKEGALVVIVGRDERKHKNIREKCEKFGREPLVIKADLSNNEDARRIIEETVNEFGRIDVLVNNAGAIDNTVNILNEDFMERYDYIHDLNLRSVVFITHLAIPHLIKTKGNIINISSTAGLSTLGMLNVIPYHVSKASLNHFTRCAAMNLSDYGIRVNTISPGPVRTDIFDRHDTKPVSWDTVAETTALKRVSDPEEIADLIIFVASHKARGVTGSNFLSDIGVLIKN